jgi:hypothetical protein
VTQLSLEQLIFQYSTGDRIELKPDKTEEKETSYIPPPIYEDPRPDLAEDSHLWNELLRIAYEFHPQLPEKNAEFCGVLNGMRCGGTRIRAGKNGWVLRPDIDPTGRVAWSSQAEYDEMKQKYLARWLEWLKFALRRLNEKHPYNQLSSGT